MRRITFDRDAFRDFNEWARIDKKVHAKIAEMIESIRRDPFGGLNKPEPLKHQFKGKWARRITKDDRLVYEVNDDEIVIVSCKEHYT